MNTGGTGPSTPGCWMGSLALGAPHVTRLTRLDCIVQGEMTLGNPFQDSGVDGTELISHDVFIIYF